MFDQVQSALSKLKEKLLSWIDAVVLNLPNFLIAVLIVLVGWFLAKYAYKFIHKLVIRAGGNRNVSDLLSSIGRVIVVGLFLFIGLSVMGLSSAVASLLAGAGIAGLAIGFALQDPLANLFSGVMMSVKELYRKGDLVKTNDFFGTIDRISLRSTVIQTLDGQEVVIPNKDVLQNPLTNFTVNRSRRVDLPIGISYGDDLNNAAKIAVKAVEENVDCLKDKPVEVFWTEFGDSSINGVLRFWQSTTSQKDYLKGRSQAIVAIKAAFDREDIMIPFPIRTLDFGIRGGETLSQMKVNVSSKNAESFS